MRLWTRAAVIGGIVGVFALALISQGASIVTSKHNMNVAFSANTIRGNQVCLPCHTPHNVTAGNPVLWNHTMNPAKIYTMYSTSSKYNIGLDFTSRMCLSCHDGAVAVDSFGGSTPSTGNAANVVGAGFNVGFGADLTRDHPVGMRYSGYATSGVWTSTTSFKDPTLFPTDIASTGEPSIKLYLAGTDAATVTPTVVGCGSCHTPHDNTYQFLRVSNAASGLCLKCHNK